MAIRNVIPALNGGRCWGTQYLGHTALQGKPHGLIQSHVMVVNFIQTCRHRQEVSIFVAEY